MAKKAPTKKTAKKKAAKKTADVRRAKTSDIEIADAPPPHPPPIALDAVLGHERPTATLQASLESGRVHHCWIFNGPIGVGKFTAALAFAAVLLDPEAGPDLSGRFGVDPESRVQRMLAAGGHPDLHIIRKELASFSDHEQTRNSKQTRIPLKVVQQFLIRPAGLAANASPGGLASKVFIVDEAELLAGGQDESQNTLLKTLEEPPEGTVIILVTSNEERLLPTIRSRSQRVVFGPLDESAMRAWLNGPGREHVDGVSPEALDWLLRSYACGSPGRLLDAIEVDLYGWHVELDRLLTEAERGVFPPELGSAMQKLVEEHAKAWHKADEKRRSKDVANRAAASKLFAMLGERARRRMAEGGSNTDAGLRIIDAVTTAEIRLRSNVAGRLVMEGLAAGIAGRGQA